METASRSTATRINHKLAHYQPWMVRFPGIRSISAQ